MTSMCLVYPVSSFSDAFSGPRGRDYVTHLALRLPLGLYTLCVSASQIWNMLFSHLEDISIRCEH